MQAYVVGYEVARSPSARGLYENISGNLLPASDSLFTDHQPLPTAYYVVKALGQDSTYTTSFPVLMQKEDDQPPVSPSGLQGTITDNGHVLLEWAPNQEDDLLGYRVFRANSQREEFVQITGEALDDNNFRDSINLATLNEYVYYKVVALDHHFNASDYSEVLELKKPDMIAPVPALFRNVQAVHGSIAFSWLPSPSEDIVAYLLLRMDEKNSNYQIIAEFPPTDSTYHYRDTQIEPGSIYRYLLRTKDDADLTSDNISVPVKAIDEKIMPPVSEISFVVSREKNLINLHWKYAPTKYTKGFKIYRSTSENTQLRMYKYLPSPAYSYTDKALHINTQYRYAIQAVFEDGAESMLSEEVLVSY
jgi:fibronectin type 3 domain-containing protein